MIDLVLENIWVIIALPLLGAITLHFVGRFLPEPLPGLVATGAIGAAFLVALIAAIPMFQGGEQAHAYVITLWDWMPSVGAAFELRWDPLASLMTLVITGVGSLIHLYSIGYMHGDERFSRFFTYLNLFAASMLTLVLANNFAMMFVGWELVGLCSFLLISFWYTRPSAAAAGKKAFIVNRIGDFAFLIGLMVLFTSFGTLSMSTILEAPGEVLSTGTATLVCLMFLIGAAGKSAQIPLYIWLPDAMEGPTPVSALIHAATMVTAGVYLVARTAAIYTLTPTASMIVATVGAATALWAATIAIGQNDIKKVLAYSTVSQLGYMFLAVGSTAYVAGTFHLMTHAFFKALLFLGAGSVIHGMADEQDMRKMGGLRKKMPLTHATMLIGTIAIAGIPPFAGFWSKDEILASTFANGGWYYVLWVVGLITALLTAFYMTRMLLMTFYGESRWDDGVEPHESPITMTGPLLALAGLSMVAGLINTPFALVLEHFLHPSFEGIKMAHVTDNLLLGILALLSIGAAVAGMSVAWLIYSKSERVRTVFERSTRRPFMAWENAYWVDDLYGNLLVLPGKGLAMAAAKFDAVFVDGIVNGVGAATGRASALLRPFQSGFVRTYGAGFAAGAVALVIWLLASGA